MRDIQPYADRTITAERAGGDVEDILRDFFRREMPHPWPECPIVDEAAHVVSLPAARWWKGARRHLSMAAALALFVLGYWTLSLLFPTTLARPSFMQSLGPAAQNLHKPNIDPGPLPGNGIDTNAPKQHSMPHKVLPGIDGPEIIETPNGNFRLWQHEDNNRKLLRIEALPKR